jgi:hypothetical protein
MRIFIFVLLLVLVPITTYGQVSVKTQDASNLYYRKIFATAGDTIFQKAAAVSGTAVRFSGVTGFVVGVLVGTPLASDSIFIKNGKDTVTQITMPASGLSPYYIPIGARLDTSLIMIKKTTSNVTIIYRIIPQ